MLLDRSLSELVRQDRPDEVVSATFMSFDTGASAHSCEQTSQEHKAQSNCDDEDRYTISRTNGTNCINGINGSLALPTMRLRTYPTLQDRSWWKPFETGVVVMVRKNPLVHQIVHFCAVVRGRAQPLVSARDGLNNCVSPRPS